MIINNSLINNYFCGIFYFFLHLNSSLLQNVVRKHQKLGQEHSDKISSEKIRNFHEASSHHSQEDVENAVERRKVRSYGDELQEKHDCHHKKCQKL